MAEVRSDNKHSLGCVILMMRPCGDETKGVTNVMANHFPVVTIDNR